MVFSKQLKICKVDNFEIAKYAVISGFDYLGVHVIEQEDIGRHLDLVNFINKTEGRSIIVTKIDSPENLKKIIELYSPIGIQLHFCPKPNLLLYLKNNYPELEIFSVITNTTNKLLINDIIDYSDKIIYDTSFVGGTAKKNDLTFLVYMNDNNLRKILIAGGVDIKFAEQYINSKYCGFDIQSYFRSAEKKYFNRLESITRLVKQPKIKQLSISLTDFKLSNFEKIRNYKNEPQISYHLDFSDGSLYEGFVTSFNEIIRKSKKMNNYPHSIHIFQNNVNSINKTIEKFICNNENAITSFFIQYFKGLDIFKIRQDINLVVSIYHKDLKIYMQKYSNKFSYISIILPSDNLELIKNILDYMNKNIHLFLNKEIWFDRALNKEKIKFIQKNFKLPFNVIVGKNITKNWRNLFSIYEQLSI